MFALLTPVLGWQKVIWWVLAVNGVVSIVISITSLSSMLNFQVSFHLTAYPLLIPWICFAWFDISSNIPSALCYGVWTASSIANWYEIELYRHPIACWSCDHTNHVVDYWCKPLLFPTIVLCLLLLYDPMCWIKVILSFWVGLVVRHVVVSKCMQCSASLNTCWHI
jgi:hypothetical protein